MALRFSGLDKELAKETDDLNQLAVRVAWGQRYCKVLMQPTDDASVTHLGACKIIKSIEEETSRRSKALSSILVFTRILVLK